MKPVKNYLKNLTKSVAYSAVDYAKQDLVPNVAEFSSINQEAFNEIYYKLKNPKMAIRRSVKAISESKVYQAIDYGARNTFEDLRTGKWYNKERIDSAAMKYSGLNVEDWNDLSEFGIEDTDQTTSTSSDISKGDLAITSTIESSAMASTNTTVSAIVSGAEYGASVSKTNTAVIVNKMQSLLGGVHTDISTTNATLNAILKLQTASFKNIDSNTSSYFTSKLKLDTERNAMLKELLEIQRNTYSGMLEEQKQKQKPDKHNRWGDVNSSGMIDIKSYVNNVVKTNFKNNVLDKYAISGFGEDSNMLATFAASPLQYVLEHGIKSLTPTNVKLATKELDKSLSGVFGTIMAKLVSGSNSDNPIKKFISSIFKVNTGVNSSIDTSKYFKGGVPFDGLTRKAIMDVIPTYLRRIEASIRGGREYVYDYDRGKWTTGSEISKEFSNMRKRSIQLATADLRDEMKSSLDKALPTSEREKKEFKDALDKFWEAMYDNNFNFNPKKTAEQNHMDNIPKQYYDIIKASYENGVRYSTKLAGAGEALTQKDALERRYREMEKNPSSVFAQLFSGLKFDSHGKDVKNDRGETTGFRAKNDKLLTLKDQYRFSIFDYLNLISRELKMQRTVTSQNIISAINSGSYNSNQRPTHINGRRIVPQRLMTERESDEQLRSITLDNGLSDEEIRKAMTRLSNDQALARRNITNASKGNGTLLSELTDANNKSAMDRFIRMAQEEYNKNYYREYNNLSSEGFISKFINSKNDKELREILGVNKRSNQENADEETAKTATNANGDENTKTEDENKKDTVFDKVKRAYNKVNNFASDLVSAPAKLFTEVLGSADRAIYETLFKTKIVSDTPNEEGEKKEYDGFIDMIKTKISSSFEGIKKKLTDKIINPLREKLGIGQDFKDRYKKAAKDYAANIFGRIVKANKEVYLNNPDINQMLAKYGLVQSSPESEDALSRRRYDKRKVAENNKASLTNITRLADPNLIRMLKENGASVIDFDDVGDAKKFLYNSYNKAIFRNSNNLKDLTTDNDFAIAQSAILNGENSNELIMKLAEKFGYNGEGQTPNQVLNGLLRKVKSQNLQNGDTLVRNNDSRNLNTYVARLGFRGSLSSKVNRLLKMGVSQEQIDAIMNNDQADKNFELNKLFHSKTRRNKANGTIFGNPFKGTTMLSKGELLFNKDGVSVVDKTDAYKLNQPTQILSSYDSHPILKSLGMNPGRRRTPAEDLATENKVKDKIFNHAEGTAKTETTLNRFTNELKLHSPETAAAGSIGALLGLLLGIPGGPLITGLGGALTGLITSSNNIKDKLFGPKSEDGERYGGIVKQETMKNVKKYAPDMFKYGAAGIIPGLITPLGPLGGILVGAGIGFLKNNERFSNKYFGENGKLTIGTKEKNILSRFLPASAIGAVGGAAAKLIFHGPFGIAGNMIIGAGIGAMTASQEFREGVLGRTVNGVRQGGILGNLETLFKPLKKAGLSIAYRTEKFFDESIATPLKKFIVPFIHEIPHWAGAIPRFINQKLEDSLLNPLKNRLKKVFSPIGKALKKAFWDNGFARAVRSIPGAILGLPGKGLSFLGDKIKSNQIARREGDYMTAAERNALRVARGGNGAEDVFDNNLTNMGRKGGIETQKFKDVRDRIRSLTDTSVDVDIAKSKQAKRIAKNLDAFTNSNGGKITAGTKLRIRKLLMTNDIEGVLTLLQRSKLSDGNTMTQSEFDSFVNGVDESGESFSSTLTRYKDFEARKSRIGTLYKKDTSEKDILADMRKRFQELGVNPNEIKSIKDLSKFEKLISSELDNAELHDRSTMKSVSARFNSDEVDEEIKKQTEIGSQSLDALKDLIDIGLTVATGGETKNIRLRTKTQIKAGIQAVNNRYEANSNAAAGIIGEDEYNNLSSEEQERYSMEGSKALKNFKEGVLSSKQSAQLALVDNKQLKLIKGIIKTYAIDDKAVDYLSKLPYQACKDIYKLLTYDIVNIVLKGRKLSLDDIKFLKTVNRKDFINGCTILQKNNTSAKDYRNLSSILDFYNNRENNVPEPQTVETNEDENTVSNHALGTVLSVLAGGAKLVAGGVKRVAGGAVKLAKGAKNAVNGVRGALSGNPQVDAVSNAQQGMGAPQMASTGNLSDVDKAGDGKSYQFLPDVNKFATVVRQSDGSVDFDTSDPNTSLALRMKAKYDKAKTAAANMRDKAMNTVQNAMSVAKGEKKPSWITMLLGAALAAPFLKKIFTSVVKPVWNKVVYPFVKDKWTNVIQPFLLEKVPQAIGSIIGGLLNGLIKSLPSLIKGAIKGTDSLISGISDASTEKEKSQTQTKVSDKMYTTDSNGKKVQLTQEQISSGNYGDVYNAEGVKGTVDEDGNVTFTNTNATKNNNTTGGKLANSVFRAATTGSAGLATPVSKLGGFLLKRKSLVAKGAGAVMKATTAPVQAAAASKNVFKAFGKSEFNSVSDKFVDALYESGHDKLGTAIENGRALPSKIASKATGIVDNLKGTKAAQASKNLLAKAKSTTVGTKIAETASSLISTIKSKVQDLFSKLFDNDLIKSKIVKEAGSEQAGGIIQKCKSKITEAINGQITVGAKSISTTTLKQVIGKALVIIPIVLDFVTGFDSAAGMLGVTSPTILERICCGAVKAVVNYIPFLSLIVSASKLLQILCTAIGGEKFTSRQKEALDEYNKYVEETGSTMSQEDYLNKDTLTYKVKKTASNAWNTVKKGASAAWNGVKKGASAAWNGVKSVFGGSKYGMGPYKQIDPSISGIRFNTSSDGIYQTIGDSGCGPIAALNAVHSAYGMGKNDEVLDATKFALNNGYKETNGGTKPNYFRDYFARNGLDSTTSYNQADIRNNILSGSPTVLMGQDLNGTSSRTPFGRNPHYVTVTGSYGDKVVVQDPESRYDNQVYKMSDVLNKSSLGVSAYGRGKSLLRKFGMSKYGRGDYDSQIWGFLKSKGCSDEGAAGIMGNLQQESGCDPTSIQGNGAGPAAGVCQWENYNTKSGRWKEMSDYASSKGKDWTDLASQLEYMWIELDGSGSDKYTNSLLQKYGGIEYFYTTKDINDACDVFEKTFERAGIPNMPNRYKYAKEFYNKFKGTSGDAIDSSSSNSSSADTGLIGKLTNLFTNTLTDSSANKALDKLTGVLVNPIYDKLFGSSSSSDDTSTSSSSGATSVAGVANGTKIDADKARGAVTGVMKYFANNKLKYSQTQRNPESGSADCSSTVEYAYMKTLGIDPGSWTQPQWTSGTSADSSAKPNVSALKPGDLLFYGNRANNATQHVEMYVGDGKLLGHGGGNDGTTPGPTEHDAATYWTSNYMGARRYIKDGEQYTFNNTSTLPWNSGSGGNGVKPSSRYGTFAKAAKPRKAKFVDINNNVSYGYSNPATGYGVGPSANVAQASTKTTTTTIDYRPLLKVAVESLVNIADNTDKLETILKVVKEKTGIEVSATDLNNASSNTETMKKKLKSALLNSVTNSYGETDTDTINNIISTMNSLASE